MFHAPKNVASAKLLLREGTLTKSAIARQVGMQVNLLYKWFPGEDLDKIRNPNLTGPGALGQRALPV